MTTRKLPFPRGLLIETEGTVAETLSDHGPGSHGTKRSFLGMCSGEESSAVESQTDAEQSEDVTILKDVIQTEEESPRKRKLRTKLVEVQETLNHMKHVQRKKMRVLQRKKSTFKQTLCYPAKHNFNS